MLQMIIKDYKKKERYYKKKERKKGGLLLLLLSRFSHVRLCATPQMAAHQAPPFLEWVAIEEASRQPGCGHFTGQWTQFLQ